MRVLSDIAEKFVPNLDRSPAGHRPKPLQREKQTGKRDEHADGDYYTSHYVDGNRSPGGQEVPYSVKRDTSKVL